MEWIALGLLTSGVAAQDPAFPLRPPDLSSPRATMKTFLDSGDAVGSFIVRGYLNSPSRLESERLTKLADGAVRCLDLSGLPPAARLKGGRASAIALYEILGRIPLPPFDAIPDADGMGAGAGTNSVKWVIPNTEIVLERLQHGPNQGEFRFDAETVSRAGEFLGHVADLPYLRTPPLPNLAGFAADGGGWMIPYVWIQAMPQALRTRLAGQAIWKWIALGLTLTGLGVVLWFAFRLSLRGNPRHPFVQALLRLMLPVTLLLATPIVTYLALFQINLVGPAGISMELAATSTLFFGGAWLSWRVAPVIAEAIISSPRIAPHSVDAHLIRISSRLLGIGVAAGLMAVGADRLGLPLYGIVAGLGVSGLAIALAAQATIENLIGGLSLFADRPVRVGDFCKYGAEIGTIESIGIRSTRIRGIDRTLTTIPNGALSKMAVVNYTQRDRMLLKSVLGLRYETTPEQLRHVLAKLRELLLAHPKVTPEPSRVRFVGFGDSSLNLEVFAYVATNDWNEFLEIQEDINLRTMEVIAESGTGFAFPSRTLYLARDGGLDHDKSVAAVEMVQAWRKDQKLPFPNFDVEFRKAHRDTLDYPPEGSSTAKPKSD